MMSHKIEFQFFSENNGIDHWGKSKRIPLVLSDEKAISTEVDSNKIMPANEKDRKALRLKMLRKLVRARKEQEELKFKIELFEEKLQNVEGEEAR